MLELIFKNSKSNYHIENENPSINVIFNVFYDDIKDFIFINNCTKTSTIL